MAKSISPVIGADINRIFKAAEVTSMGGVTRLPFSVLQVVTGDDNARYVFAKAAAALSSGLATCAISAAGDVTATAGTYKAPTVTGGLASGDYAWFRQAYPA